MGDLDGGKPLALSGSLDGPLRWLIGIMLVPLVGLLLGLGLVGLPHATAAARLPLLIVASTGPIVILLTLALLARSFRRAGVRVEEGDLVVNSGLGSKRVRLAALRSKGLRVVNLNEQTELRPWLRLWGSSLPGFSGGRFRLRNGETAICLLLERTRVSYLRSDEDQLSLLLSLAEPDKLRTLLER